MLPSISTLYLVMSTLRRKYFVRLFLLTLLASSRSLPAALVIEILLQARTKSLLAPSKEASRKNLIRFWFALFVSTFDLYSFQ